MPSLPDLYSSASQSGDFGPLLSELKLAHNLTSAALAFLLDCTRRSVDAWTNGDRRPRQTSFDAAVLRSLVLPDAKVLAMIEDAKAKHPDRRGRPKKNCNV